MGDADLSDLSEVIEYTLGQLELISASQARFQAVVQDVEEAWQQARAVRDEGVAQVREFSDEVERLRKEGRQGWKQFLKRAADDLERRRAEEVERWAALEARARADLEELDTRRLTATAEAVGEAWDKAIEAIHADGADLQAMVAEDVARLRDSVEKAIAQAQEETNRILRKVREEAKTSAAATKRQQKEVAAEIETARASSEKALKDMSGRIRTLEEQGREQERAMRSVEKQVSLLNQQRTLPEPALAALDARLRDLSEGAARDRGVLDALTRRMQNVDTSVNEIKTRLSGLTDHVVPDLRGEVQRLGSSTIIRLLTGRRKTAAPEQGLEGAD